MFLNFVCVSDNVIALGREESCLGGRSQTGDEIE